MTFTTPRFITPLALLLVLGLTGCGGGGGGSSETLAAGTPTQDAEVSESQETVTDVAAEPAVDPMLRKTALGEVEGVESGDAYAWLGVPYAAPPVGELRWKAPVAPQPWSEPLKADAFGAACPQMPTFGLESDKAVAGAEDCLTLNIWSPRGDVENLPVLVFVHGGSNLGGWAGTPDYNGARLAAEQNVVVVSVHYRLGVLGWMAHPALRIGEPATDSGNFGTLDLIRALEFVGGNIAAFGGNPENVTIAGQSAGAKNVWSLIASSYAEGLFHKAVSWSGGLKCVTPTEAQSFARKLLIAMLEFDGTAAAGSGGVYLDSMTEDQIRDYLHSQTAERLVMATTVVGGFMKANVICDGTVLPSSQSMAFTSGDANYVPVLSGVTEEEGKYFSWPTHSVTGEELATYRETFDPNNPDPNFTIDDLVRSAYLPIDWLGDGAYDPATQTYNTGYNDFAMRFASLSTAFFWTWDATTLDEYVAYQPATYSYSFAWNQQPGPWGDFLGAAHVVDLAFWFGNFGEGMYDYTYSEANEPGREALSKVMRTSLAAFMRNGDPNTSALTTAWQAWTPGAGQPKRLVLDADDDALGLWMSTDRYPTY